MVPRLLKDEFGSGAHVACKHVGGRVADFGSELDGGGPVQRIEYVRLKLLQSLVSENQSDIEFPRLIENDRDFRVALDEIVTFVDVDKARKALLFRQKLPLVRGEQDHRNEKAAHDLHAVFLKEALRDIDEDDFPRAHLG